MAFVRAFRSGLWSDTNPATSPWGTGGVLYAPASDDEVYSNGHTIHVDQNINVIRITNYNTSTISWKDGGSAAATINGIFNLYNNVTVTATINTFSFVYGNVSNTTHTDTVLVSGNNSANISGNIGGGGSTTALRVTTSGIVYITGNVMGGNNVGGTSGAGIIISNGTLNITGNIYGGCRGFSNFNNSGILTSNNSSVTITGDLSDPDRALADPCIAHGSAGNVIIIGNIYGGTLGAVVGGGGISVGLSNNSTGAIVVYGNLFASNTQALWNRSTGPVFVNGNVFASSRGGAGLNVVNPAAPINISGNIINAPNGIAAIYAPSFRYDPVPRDSYVRYARNGTGVGSDAWLYQFTTDSLSAFSMPPVSAVRLGTTFANATLTGTCVIPSPSSVAFGVPTDNTTGQAVFSTNTFFDVPLSAINTPDSIGARIKNAATIESAGYLLASFTTN